MGLASDNQAQLNAWQQAAGGIRELLLGHGDLTWQQARDAYVEQLETLFPAPVGVDLKTVDMDGVPALLITPENVIDDRALFYIHGGGYVHGGARACCGLAGHYAKGLRARVYLPEYRQAPEFQYPTPIDDVFRAYRALLDNGHGSTRIAMSGDSAGGALVITVMRKARDAGLSLPVAGVALSPWADLTQSGHSATTRDGLDPLCSVAFLDRLARAFLGNALASDPDVSPVHADVRGLAPILIQAGENEVMLSGAMRLAEHLAEQRVRTTLEVWPGMFHVWHQFVGHMPEADEALSNAIVFLAREFGRASA